MDKQEIALRYLSVTHWLAKRYAMTDKNGRVWHNRKRNGKPTRYGKLEQAVKAKYFEAMRRAKDV